MKKHIKRLLRIILPVILIPIAGFLLFLTAAQIFQFSPPLIEETEILSSGSPDLPASVPIGESLRILDWNIGYGGLDAGSDFVMDGGTQGLPESRSRVEENLLGISGQIKSVDADFYLFQEVDRYSKRSYRVDQAKILSSLKPAYDSRFAMNFKVFFIPYPVHQPIGRVKSGLLSLSTYKVAESLRHQLPGSYSWPTRLFMLRRCISVSRYDTGNSGRSFYLANVHLSAYDDGGMRRQQLEYLKQWMKELYSRGDYVILGGDWNSLFPGVSFEDFAPYTTTEKNLYWIQNIPENWTPEKWQWGWDPEVPSCRTLDQAYIPGENFRTIIDGFLVSPNVQIDEIRTSDAEFSFSDHNPVSLKFKLKP